MKKRKIVLDGKDIMQLIGESIAEVEDQYNMRTITGQGAMILRLQRLLGAWLDDEAEVDLFNALDDEDRWIRCDAIQAISVLIAEKSKPALLKALDDKDKFVRKMVILELWNAKFRDNEVIDKLMNMLNSEDPDIQKVVIKTLTFLSGRRFLFGFGRNNIQKWNEWWNSNKDNFK